MSRRSTKSPKRRGGGGDGPDDATARLLAAATEGRNDRLVQIIDTGGQIDALDGKNATAMHKAAAKGRHSTVAVIISLGSRAINSGDKHGQTPLHWAAFGGCSVTTDILLDNGADPRAQDNYGRTAAHVAKAKGLDMLRKRLVGAGGPPPGDNWPGPGKQWSLKHYWTENNEAALCMCCQHRKFTMTVRRHHCRQCGDVICSDCTQMAKPPWHTPVNKTELVCFTCTNVWSSEDSSKGIYSANQILPKGATEGGASPAGPPPDSEIVDELRAYPWYRDWSRPQTEDALLNKGGRPGDYIVRPSSQPGSFALSFLAFDPEGAPGTLKVEHRLVVNFNGGWFIKIENASGRYTSFDSIPDLLQYYSTANGVAKPLVILLPYGTAANGAGAGGSAVAETNPFAAAAAAAAAGVPATNPFAAAPVAGSQHPQHPQQGDTQQQPAGWGGFPPGVGAPVGFNAGPAIDAAAQQRVEADYRLADGTDFSASTAAAAQPDMLAAGADDRVGRMESGESGSYADSGSYGEDDDDGVIDIGAAAMDWELQGLELPPPPPASPDVPPSMPEPVFQATGFAEVDTQIRARMMAQQVAAWRAEADIARGGELAAHVSAVGGVRQRRTVAVATLQSAAAIVLAFEGPSSFPGFDVIIEAGVRLAPFLDAEDADVGAEVAAWQDELAIRTQAEADRIEAVRLAAIASLLEDGGAAQELNGAASIDALRYAIQSADDFAVSTPVPPPADLTEAVTGWRTELDLRVAAEEERVRVEQEQAAAALVLQSGYRGMKARSLAAARRAEIAEQKAQAAAARAERIAEIEVEWDAANTLEGRDALLQMEEVMAAVVAEFGPIDRLDELASWVSTLDTRRQIVEAAEQAKLVAHAMVLAEAALADEDNIAGLENAIAAADQCIATDELDIVVKEWEQVLATRKEEQRAALMQQEADAILDRGEVAMETPETEVDELQVLVEEAENSGCIELIEEDLDVWREELDRRLMLAEDEARMLRAQDVMRAGELTMEKMNAVGLEDLTEELLRELKGVISRIEEEELVLVAPEVGSTLEECESTLAAGGHAYLKYNIEAILVKGDARLKQAGGPEVPITPGGAPPGSLRKMVKTAQKFIARVAQLLNDDVVKSLPQEMDLLGKSVQEWVQHVKSETPRGTPSRSPNPSALPTCLACSFVGQPADKFCEHCGHRFPEEDKSRFLRPGLAGPRPELFDGSVGENIQRSEAEFMSQQPQDIAPKAVDLTDELLWQFGPLDRDRAQALLSQRGLESGAFLVREAQSPGALYSLSLRINDLVRHYRIVGDEDEIPGLSFKGSQLRFKSLVHLVLHYAATEPSDALPIALTTPCPKKTLTATSTDKWEIKRDDIQLLGSLGAGNFGEVRQGRLQQKIDVAVKTSKADKMTSTAFLKEADKMKKLRHQNIVRLYGVCTIDDPILIVIEYLGGGCLLDFLHSRKGRNMDVQQQCAALGDVAAGMSFMQVHHWIHGDLAARNLLVSTTGIVKICDFGHAVQTDELDTPVLVSQQLPVRWTAPEFYKTRRCSPESDVWSFGVIIFEVLSRGEEPYATMRDNKEVMQLLFTGWRMPKDPKKYPDSFYKMMLHCWDGAPNNRPHFSFLADTCRHWKNVVPRESKKLVDSRNKQLPYTPP